MCTHGGSSIPRVITLFTQGHRVSHTPSQILFPRFSFLIIVPRSGSSFLVPDITYRFITPSPPSEKEASLTPGIIYTIILLTLVWAIPFLKTRNSLKKYLQRWGSTEKPQKITTMHSGPSVVCLVRASLLSCVLFLFMVNP